MKRSAFQMLVLLVLSAVVLPLSAQMSADPNHELYEWMDIWEGRGYVQHLPVMRPYPEPVLVDALERVVQVGDPSSQAAATEWLDRLSGSFDMEVRAIAETRTQDGELFHAKGALEFALHGRLAPHVSVAASMTGIILDVEDGELLPYGERTDWDILEDWSSIPFPGGRDVAALNQVRTSFAWGTPSLYLHAGIMRRSFGPFFDESMVWNAGTYQAPGFVGHWSSGDFRFTAE
jgi:hypothetical protein